MQRRNAAVLPQKKIRDFDFAVAAQATSID
jgi:hypothetical protein